MTTNQNALEQALSLGESLQRIRREIAQKEEEAKALKRQAATIEQETLPALFEDLGIQSVTLADGTLLQLKTFPVGRLSPATREQALQWLRDHNHEGIISNTFKVGLRTHQNEQARQLEDFLRGSTIPFDKKMDVHSSTLKAFIREMADSPEFPRDLFNVYDVKQVEFSTR